MRFSENRAIAWIVLAACVAGSVVGFGGAGLARERKEIVEVFYEGAEDRDSTHCMSAYIDRAFENARVMAKEVQLRLDANHAGAAEVLQLLDGYDPEADDGFFACGSTCKQLREWADDLYNDIYAANLPDDQRVDFKVAYDDFQGAVKFIEKDPYLQLAADFNDDRAENFLTGLVCKLGGTDRLCETF